MADYFNFLTESRRIHDHQTDEIFYIFPDKLQLANYPLPDNLEDAYANGFLVVEFMGSGQWYLNIANCEHFGTCGELAKILFDWAVDEGYDWP